MSHTIIQRDPEDAEDLYVWWDDATLGAGAEVVCGDNEVAAFYDGEQVLAVAGPGRTVLTSAAFPALAHFLERHLLSKQPDLTVCFISTLPAPEWEVEVECGVMTWPDGMVGQLACWTTVTLLVTKPELFVGEIIRAEQQLSSETDDEAVGDDTVDDSGEEETDVGEEEDEDEEDEDGEDDEPNPIELFLAQAVRPAVARVMLDDKPEAAAANAAVKARLPELLTKDLSRLGLQVVSVDEVALYRDGRPLSPE